MKQSRRRRIGLIAALLLFAILVLRLTGWFTTRPDNLGANAGQLARCPTTPNCVCSQSDPTKPHYIESFQVHLRNHFPPGARPKIPIGGVFKTQQEALRTLARAVDDLPGTTLIRQTDDYLHFEFRTLVLGFVDDVEFLLDANHPRIDIRSASRIGYSDIGTNRHRVEKIRKIWTETDLIPYWD